MATTEMKVKLNAEPFEILSRHFSAYANVIEAAKAWRKRYRRGIRFVNGDDAFAELIEALEGVTDEPAAAPPSDTDATDSD